MQPLQKQEAILILHLTLAFRRAYKAIKVRPGRRGPLVRQAHKVKPVLKEQRVLLGRKVNKDKLVQRAHKARLVPLARLVKLALKARLAFKVRKVNVDIRSNFKSYMQHLKI